MPKRNCGLIRDRGRTVEDAALLRLANSRCATSTRGETRTRAHTGIGAERFVTPCVRKREAQPRQ
jgi:hypothetical protein